MQNTRHGFTLLEVIPALSVVVMIMTIVIVALNPKKQFATAHNTRRKADIALIADAIFAKTQDDPTRALFLQIPTDAPIEICGDIYTGSCSLLIDFRSLIDDYLIEIPIDPTSNDTDTFNEHTRYFVIRTNRSVTVTAQNTEPEGSTPLSVTR